MRYHNPFYNIILHADFIYIFGLGRKYINHEMWKSWEIGSFIIE